ncbi:MAG: TAXI family TRAP transporter solute-binding subunit [Alphaproteobacteria bacterium]|nr:TAXI family TRAP transporter solute-binding subunit [Alphaproteobacteria bacterium]
MMLARALGLAAGLALAASALPAQAQTPGANWPKALTLGTASVGGTYFVYGQAWASMVGAKIGVPISTQQTQGPNQNLILVNDKQIELGMVTMGVALQGWEGKGDWTQGKARKDFRALFPMYDTPFHHVALQKSGIKSVADLKGKTIGVGPRAGTCGTYFPLIFKALDIDVKIVNGQASDMGTQLADGLITAFPFCAGLPIAAFSELDKTQKVTFFGYTDAELAKIQKAMPEFSLTSVPKGTYSQQTQDDKTVGIFNFAIIHKDLPDTLAYAIVKAVHENHADMVKGHAAAKETLPQNVKMNTFLPFHPGAAKYYKEKGIAIPAKLGG